MIDNFIGGLALLETAGGRKTIKGPAGEDSYNLFNIKDFTGKGYRAHDKAEGTRDAYRVYASADESKADLMGLLERKYPKALQARTGAEFAQALKAGGYATDPAYVQKLTGAIDAVALGKVANPLAGITGGAPRALAEPSEKVRSADLMNVSVRPRAPKADVPTVSDMTPMEKDAATKLTVAAGAAGAQAALADPGKALDWYHTNERWTPQGPGVVNVFAQAQAEMEASVSAETARQETSFAEQVGAAFVDNPSSTIWRRITRGNFEPDGTSPSDDDLKGLTAEQQTALQAASSAAERAWLTDDWKDQELRQQAISARGGFRAFIAGSLGELADPVTMVATLGAGSVVNGTRAAIMGTRAASRGANVAATLAGTAVENAAVSLAMEATKQRFGGQGDEGDLFNAAMWGAAIPTAVVGTGLAVKGAAQHIFDSRTAAQRTAQATIDREVGYLNRAQENLGDGVDAAALNAEVSRLKLEDRKAPIEGALDTGDESRQLLPKQEDYDAAELEVEQLEGARQAEVTRLAEEAKVAEQAQPPKEDFSGVEVRELTDAEAAALFDEVAAEQAAGKAVLGDELKLRNDRRMAGLALPAIERTSAWSELTRLARDAVDPMIARVAPWLRAAMREDVDIHVFAEGTVGQATRGASERSHYDPATNRIVLDTRRTDKAGWGGRGSDKTVLHEIGHAVTSYKLDFGSRNPQTATGKLTSEFTALRETVRKQAMAADMPAHVKHELLYLTENNDEFAAGFFSGNGAFVDFLRSVKSTSGRSTLTQLGELIRSILGIPQREFNALFDGYDILDDISKNPLSTTIVSKRNPEFTVKQAPVAAQANWLLQDSTAQATGLNLLPMDSIKQQVDARALVALHKKAEAWAKKNPKDAAWDKRVKTLTDNRIISVDSTALIMLKSDNPVTRYLATELVEDASGASGIRQSTASISKYINQRLIMGNAINDLQDVYAIYKKQKNVGKASGIYGDIADGKLWQEFNKAVAIAIENRQAGKVAGDATIERAADILGAAYGRARELQVRHGTPGSKSLPESSYGYMPHRMSPGRIREASVAQKQVLHEVLVDQFITIEGWDATFADHLASKYLARMVDRSAGDYGSSVNMSQTGTEDLVEDAMRKMGLGQNEITARMNAWRRSGPGYTKKRLRLDLNKQYTRGGETFRLLDLFETDHIKLLRAQADRVSGEAALAKHGVHGVQGMRLLRKAMEYGRDGQTTTTREFEAFDQITAELLGMPFGTAEGKWMGRARELTAVTKLGGIVFNQFAEYINGVFHVGAGRTLSSIGGIGRLLGEVRKLAKGEKVDNPIIGSIEAAGAEFGTDAYKLVFPFDDSAAHSQVYGQDTAGMADRLLRGAGHLQSKLSFWRAMHGAQSRGMAEQIVHKALRYIRDGGEDKALADMGFTAAMVKKMQGQLAHSATWNGNTLTSFDVTKITDAALRDDFIQAVHRGTNQIIQGTFIGETGKWAHDGLMKTLTQFRTFSLVSMEKQWRRQRNTRGLGVAIGVFIGSMALAAPVYIARTYLQSIGRPDQEEYLDKHLAYGQIARATLNYMAVSGLLGDWIDGVTAAMPEPVQKRIGEITGGRTGANTGAIGNLIAPSAGTVDDLYQILKNLDDPSKAAQMLPGSRLPGFLQIINTMGKDE